MSPGEGNFYITGGTLYPDAPCYIEREGDRVFLGHLMEGTYCYVLTSRQMGKSSLMVRTAQRLRERGLHVAVLDLTICGQNLNAEQWYYGLLEQLGRQLALEDELVTSWEAGTGLGPCQRLFHVLGQVVLPALQARRRLGPGVGDSSEAAGGAGEGGALVVFVDEIDMVRSLTFSTDEFFAAIRECYNRRSHDPRLQQLRFALLGVATPADLIRDPRSTPFNLGQRVELGDFSPTEVEGLARGLGSEDQAGALMERIYHWTEGHPYLTQRLCRAVAETNRDWLRSGGRAADGAAVDQLCHELFLSRAAREEDHNLLFVRDRVLRSEVGCSNLLLLYDQVRRSRRPVPVQRADPRVSALLLSGLVRAEDGHLRVRNRIYARVFDRAWVRRSLPETEQGHYRRAYWKATRRVGLVALAAVGIAVGFGLQQARIARMELERNQELKTLDAFFELSEDLFVMANADGFFVKVNRKWEEVLGYTREELYGRRYVEFVHPEDRDATVTRAEQLRGGRSVLNFTNRYRTRQGGWVQLVWRASRDPQTGLIWATARVQDSLEEPMP